MSRYTWLGGRDQSSPYDAAAGGHPAVTDEDFSYITSQDLDDPTLALSDGIGHGHHRAHSNAAPPPEDDVLLIKNKGVIYPAHFPAYSIGDGKLRVKDVRDRAGMMMDLSSKSSRRIKLLYKGRQLKEPDFPVREYGVKNKSELMAVVAEVSYDSSPSEEEMVVDDQGRLSSKSRRKHKGKRGKRSEKSDGESTSSPRNSNSAFDPSLPAASPDDQAAIPLQKLNDIASEYRKTWVPLCEEFIASPPSDPKKREEDHRKLSESVMQHVMLKLDGVATEGIPKVKARRKEIVQKAQDMLRDLDRAKES